MERCAQCGANLVMVGRVHRCIPRAPSLADPDTKSLLRPAQPPKRGRPRIGERRDKPWLVEKMSRATWYRRKAEKAAAAK